MLNLLTALFLITAPATQSHEPAFYGLPLAGAAAEEFLKNAEIIKMEDIPVGITDPLKVTLTDGYMTVHAIWKTIDEEERIERLENRVPEIGFTDSYKHEIAAYELDKLLGLKLVPPTVCRKIKGKKGSLQIWVEGVMMNTERRRRGIQPTRPQLWNNQMYTVRLFKQLTYDTDYKNVSNLLVDPEFRIYAIDFSRAFRLHGDLRREESLSRFSYTVLDRLRTLDTDEVRDRLGPWLTKGQIKSLLERREDILELADEKIAERGEAAVMYP